MFGPQLGGFEREYFLVQRFGRRHFPQGPVQSGQVVLRRKRVGVIGPLLGDAAP
jgi:hypothetical protein